MQSASCKIEDARDREMSDCVKEIASTMRAKINTHRRCFYEFLSFPQYSSGLDDEGRIRVGRKVWYEQRRSLSIVNRHRGDDGDVNV